MAPAARPRRPATSPIQPAAWLPLEAPACVAGPAGAASGVAVADPSAVSAAVTTNEGAGRCSSASAGLHGTDIGFVHAHATSTPVGDRLEAQAIKAIAGSQVPVTSTKSLTGHLLGGAGALAAIATLQALLTGDLPGTYNVAALDPEVDLNVITGTASGSTATAGLVNAFGFGGHSAALVVTRA